LGNKINNGMELPRPRTQWTALRLVILLGSLALLLVVTAAAPTEKTLGVNIRLVYLHGAWVWTALIIFLAAALVGLAALFTRRASLHTWSQALGHTGMCYWLTYLPMSLLIMQLNWGGLFFDEPRWRVPFTFAIIGLLLQAGLWIISQPAFTSAGNLVFGAALLFSLRNTENVLHPDSPIFNSTSRSIQLFFAILVLLSLGVGVQVALAWKRAAVKTVPPAIN
jgi:uncharacterized integral membrane protein